MYPPDLNLKESRTSEYILVRLSFIIIGGCWRL